MLRIAALNLYGVGSWKQVRARRMFSITFQSKSSSTPNGRKKTKLKYGAGWSINTTLVSAFALLW
jgi:hypothetical protein